MRRDIASLLQSGQDSTARIRIEHVIREENILAANELIELFCELIVARLTIITKQRECPADLKEGIASVIFAAPRCSEIPELAALRDVFQNKYGADFVSAATDLRPNCGVNRMLIDKLSVRTPTGEVKLKVMKEIAQEHKIDWDITESEKELLKPPEEPIEGLRTFVSASSLPIEPKQPTRSINSQEGVKMDFEDTASAAEAAAESAKQAIAAAQAAAYLATKASGFDKNSVNSQFKNHPGRVRETKSFRTTTHAEVGKVCRRHSYNGNSDIKFDESDCDEESEMEEQVFAPSFDDEEDQVPHHISAPRPPPILPDTPGHYYVHPKLPDYDALAARFEALRYHKQ